VDTGISGTNVFVGGVNDNDAIIGYYGESASITGFVWQPGTGQTSLGTLFPAAGCSVTWPRGINNAGQIVGRSNPCDGSQFRPFIWQSGVIEDLNTLIPANSNWQLIEADGVNNAGQIVGYGMFNGQQRGFVMTPNY
jgi:probable HAF family extracellular repeat protein